MKARYSIWMFDKFERDRKKKAEQDRAQERLKKFREAKQGQPQDSQERIKHEWNGGLQ